MRFLLQGCVWFPLATLACGAMMMTAVILGLALTPFLPLLQAMFWLMFSIVFAAAGEEALFRYFLMDRLCLQKLQLRFWWALAASSVAFGLVHAVNRPWPDSFPQILATTLGGAVWGWTYKRWGFGWAIALHSFHNFLIYSKFWTLVLSLLW